MPSVVCSAREMLDRLRAGGRFFFLKAKLFDANLDAPFLLTISLSLSLSPSLPLSLTALSRPPSLPDVAATPSSTAPVRTRPVRTLSRPSSYSSGLGDIGGGGVRSASGGTSAGNAAGTTAATTGTNASGKPARTRPTNNQLL